MTRLDKRDRQLVWLIASLTVVLVLVVGLVLKLNREGTSSSDQARTLAKTMPKPSAGDASEKFFAKSGAQLLRMHKIAMKVVSDHDKGRLNPAYCHATADQLERVVPADRVFGQLEGVPDATIQSLMNQERIALANSLGKCLHPEMNVSEKDSIERVRTTSGLATIRLKQLGV